MGQETEEKDRDPNEGMTTISNCYYQHTHSLSFVMPFLVLFFPLFLLVS